MMTVQTVLQDLETLILATEPADIPELLGALERARSQALARLMSTRSSAPEPALLTMEQVAEHLHIKLSQARDLGRRGELPVVLVGERFVRVRQDALEDWIRCREAGGKLKRNG